MSAIQDPNDALGRRCDIGCETWPDTDEFKTCPTCGDPTKRYRGVQPLDAKAATSARLHAEFEAYYEARGER